MTIHRHIANNVVVVVVVDEDEGEDERGKCDDQRGLLYFSVFFPTKFKRIISEQANSLKGRGFVHHVVPQWYTTESHQHILEPLGANPLGPVRQLDSQPPKTL